MINWLRIFRLNSEAILGNGKDKTIVKQLKEYFC